MDIEKLSYAYYDQPELVHAVNEDLLTFNLGLVEKMKEEGIPTFITIAEDMSYNHGPMISEKIFKELKDQPRIQADLMDTIGLVYGSLGLYDQASPLAEEALAKRREILGDEHVELAQSINNVGALLGYKGDYAGAEQMHREALAMRRSLLGETHKDVAESLNNLAVALSY